MIRRTTVAVSSMFVHHVFIQRLIHNRKCYYITLTNPNPNLMCVAILLTDKPIGRLVFGSFMFARGLELDHWNAMLANEKEQISKWHTLTN